jgi:hypothetical protein
VATASGVWVGVGGDGGGGFLAEADVAAEAGQVLVAGFGLEFGGGASVLGEVLQCRVAELVECVAAAVGAEVLGGLFEEVLGAWVGQSAAAGDGQMSAAASARVPEVGARRSVRNTGPEVRPCRRRGSRRAVPVDQCTYSIAPPLES